MSLTLIPLPLCLFLIFFSNSLFSYDDTVFKGWTHLELGAGNYGKDGHIKAFQAMTVLIENVSEADDLEETDLGNNKPEEQYGILFWTLDQLISRYGDIGVFHINDLYEKYALFATRRLREYATKKGYDSVIIESIPGDYWSLDFERCLSKYGRTKYDSIHLKNPEISFFQGKKEEDRFLISETTRQQTRNLLKNLANHSWNGLYLFILYFGRFIPLEERTEFVEKGIFYLETHEWEPVPYIYPEGQVVDKMNSRVFFIETSK